MNIKTAVSLLFCFPITVLVSVTLFAQENLANLGGTGSTADLSVASDETGGTQESYKNPSDWWIGIYPVLAWAPVFGVSTSESFSMPGGSTSMPGGGSLLPPANASGSLNGAAFAGLRIEKGKWSGDSTVLWASLSGERSNPYVRIGTHFVFGQAMGGREVLPNLFLEGGVRRLALDISVKITTYPELDRTPGFWDPLVGVTYRRQLSKKWRIYGHADGGGFGAGADVDLSVAGRAEWQFARHFGLTMGYGLLHFSETNTVARRSLEVNETLHGPIFGLGIFF